MEYIFGIAFTKMKLNCLLCSTYMTDCVCTWYTDLHLFSNIQYIIIRVEDFNVSGFRMFMVFYVKNEIGYEKLQAYRTYSLIMTVHINCKYISLLYTNYDC